MGAKKLKNNISKKKKNLEIFSKSINSFIEVVINNFDFNDLNILNNNIKNLKIKYKKFEFRNLIENANTFAEYDPIPNIIYIGNDDSIWHEFFHMLSSTVENGVLYSGFSRTSFKSKIKHIGYGLNEGYTELLARRYFVNSREINTYDTEVYVAERLEKIIGKKRMESLYSTANLDGLINELIKYDSEDAIIKFIEAVDVINDYFISTRKNSNYTNMVISNLKNINEFLLKIYAMKQKEQLENKLINIEEFNNLLATFVSTLGESIKIEGDFYKYFTIINIQNVLRKVLENPDLVITREENNDKPIKK